MSKSFKTFYSTISNIASTCIRIRALRIKNKQLSHSDPSTRMALVTVSGFPCSGKTTRARQLAAYFSKRAAEVAESSGTAKYDVVLVDDEGCHVTRAAYDGESSQVGLGERLDRGIGIGLERGGGDGWQVAYCIEHGEEYAKIGWQ